MGHNIMHEVYPENVDRNKVQRDWDNCAAPVVHGEWIRPHWKNSDYCCDCSKCGGEAMHREYQWNKKGIYPICPNCGAKMK